MEEKLYLVRKYMELMNTLDTPIIVENLDFSIMGYDEVEIILGLDTSKSQSHIKIYRFSEDEMIVLMRLDILHIEVYGKNKMQIMVAKKKDAISKVIYHIERGNII